VISRHQLLGLGHDSRHVDAQIAAERWQPVTSTVIATNTGQLTREQRHWVGVLHGGPRAAIGGLSALEIHGLRNWHRDDITVMVRKSDTIEPVEGFRFVETRRVTSPMLTNDVLPLWRVEPAALLFAGYEPVTRSAYGLLAAVVQQRLSTPEQLTYWITAMKPLRRAKGLRRVLSEFAGGAHSLAEIDLGKMCDRFGIRRPARQVRRRDASGRTRFTDAEWRLADGRRLVLEVDGAFHMDVDSWEDDIVRQRALSDPDTVIIRCTSRELRDDPDPIARDLRRFGL